MEVLQAAVAIAAGAAVRGPRSACRLRRAVKHLTSSSSRRGNELSLLQLPRIRTALSLRTRIRLQQCKLHLPRAAVCALPGQLLQRPPATGEMGCLIITAAAAAMAVAGMVTATTRTRRRMHPRWPTLCLRWPQRGKAPTARSLVAVLGTERDVLHVSGLWSRLSELDFLAALLTDRRPSTRRRRWKSGLKFRAKIRLEVKEIHSFRYLVLC